MAKQSRAESGTKYFIEWLARQRQLALDYGAGRYLLKQHGLLAQAAWSENAAQSSESHGLFL
jgi:hypothetical protein